MDAERLVAALERFGRALPGLVEGVSAAEARWKPGSGAWSILEIVRHLGDEEAEDFRTRVRMTLEGAAGEYPHPEYGRSRRGSC